MDQIIYAYLESAWFRADISLAACERAASDVDARELFRVHERRIVLEFVVFKSYWCPYSRGSSPTQTTRQTLGRLLAAQRISFGRHSILRGALFPQHSFDSRAWSRLHSYVTRCFSPSPVQVIVTCFRPPPALASPQGP